MMSGAASPLNRFRTQLVRWILAALVPLALSGCLNVEGVHYVNHRGESDAGSYSMSMLTATYLGVLSDDPGVFNNLRKFSDPRITHSDGVTRIADTSGNAKMESFYDQFTCKPTPGMPGWSDCRFSYSKGDLTFPAWSVDWTVVLHKGMVILQSNHDRKVTRDGVQILTWKFDGNRVNSFDIAFTVRVPNA